VQRADTPLTCFLEVSEVLAARVEETARFERGTQVMEMSYRMQYWRL
jgi:hypothetical protein